MANRTLNMVKLKRAFQMLSASTPQREICAQLHIGRGVLNRYKKLADEAKVAYGTIGRMSEEQIHSLLQSAPTPKPSEQKKELEIVQIPSRLNKLNASLSKYMYM